MTEQKQGAGISCVPRGIDTGFALVRRFHRMETK